jgi:hypothetical protein
LEADIVITKRDELARVVSEDLEYLADEWNASIADSALRRGSATLRRLLVADDLGRAWRLTGRTREPVVLAPGIDEALAGFDLRRVVLASAGGAEYRGVTVAAVVMGSGPPPAVGTRSRDTSGRKGPNYLSLPLKGFMEAYCLFHQQRFIRRRHVVKYVANKLGGAHLDSKRGSGGEEDLAFKAMDGIIDGNFELAEKQLVYFELLGIGQAISSSPDVKELRTQLKGL